MGKRKISDLKVSANQRIHHVFRNAKVVHIVYEHDGARAMAVHPDGVKEYMFVPYTEPKQELGQHFSAMKYIQTMN